MPVKLPGLPPIPGRKLLGIGLLLVIAAAFVSFLFSLSGDDSSKGQTASDFAVHQQAGTARNNAGTQPQVPAAKRYDYASMVNEPLPDRQENVNADSTGVSGTITPPPAVPVQPQGSGQQGSPAMQAPQAEPAPAQPQAQAQPQPQLTETLPQAAILTCGSFTTEGEAQQQKALIAFQGVSSEVIRSGSGFALQMGPFASREEGRNVFNKLAAQGLVQQCALSDAPAQ